MSKEKDSYGKYPKLTINLYGECPQAKEIDAVLAKLQGRDSVQDPKIREEMRVKVFPNVNH